MIGKGAIEGGIGMSADAVLRAVVGVGRGGTVVSGEGNVVSLMRSSLNRIKRRRRGDGQRQRVLRGSDREGRRWRRRRRKREWKKRSRRRRKNDGVMYVVVVVMYVGRGNGSTSGRRRCLLSRLTRAHLERESKRAPVSASKRRLAPLSAD